MLDRNILKILFKWFEEASSRTSFIEVCKKHGIESNESELIWECFDVAEDKIGARLLSE